MEKITTQEIKILLTKFIAHTGVLGVCFALGSYPNSSPSENTETFKWEVNIWDGNIRYFTEPTLRLVVLD